MQTLAGTIRVSPSPKPTAREQQPLPASSFGSKFLMMEGKGFMGFSTLEWRFGIKQFLEVRKGPWRLLDRFEGGGFLFGEFSPLKEIYESLKQNIFWTYIYFSIL